ncbi:TetR/AcrR family transcriptional regulator [Kutzneria sp. CA-103260]|uniref:TetR/AcrR family transcriptional regulator n=1 Tax=Kutzneria sp. CA-103260 TaxID=2802641 RepID=UPI001BA55FBF|nr:TetR/AcrR family transcriptional regulator [Kutzneria sp. CA-103260]QUQ62763.1 TetR family transcriptional regulator [Kutzneria sp. CA-103260]
MSPRRSDSRERMVRSAAALLREYGANATTLDRVLTHSGAPRGSLYHHFPGGRTQLVEEAVALAGRHVGGLIDRAALTEDPVETIDAFFALWREQLLTQQFRTGCPIAAVAVETNDDAPQLAESAGRIFGEWRQTLTGILTRGGVPEERAKRLASLIVTVVEGALIVCRAEQSIEPLDAAAAEVRELVANTI